MPIKKTEPPKDKPKIHLPDGSVAGEKKQKPLIQLTLPAPVTGSPDEPLPVGKHNFCAQKNFKEVANVLIATINNQKLMSLTVLEQDKKIKDLQKNMRTISKNIKKIIKG